MDGEKLSDARHIASPSRWCISYQQLLELDEQARDLFGEQEYPQKTMRDICARIILPKCRETGTSYALYLNPKGLPIHAFATHSWDGYFAEFVMSFVHIYQTHVQKPNLWICAFALVQSTDEAVVANQLGQQEDSLEDSPFVKALKEASEFCVIRNSTTDIYSRIWCVCELMYANKYHLKTQVSGPDCFSTAQTSCLDAQASRTKDKARILKVLLSENDPEYIDHLVQRYRTYDTPQNVFFYDRHAKRGDSDTKGWFLLLFLSIMVGLAAILLAFPTIRHSDFAADPSLVIRNHYTSHQFTSIKSLLSGEAPQHVDIFNCTLKARRVLTGSKNVVPDDLFQEKTFSQNEIRRVLILGNPGTGKTTLAKQLAYRWSVGKLWRRDFDVVYMLVVRDLQRGRYDGSSIRREPMLATVIMNQCFSLDPAAPYAYDDDAYREMRNQIGKTLGNSKTLVILDGLDERNGACEELLSQAQHGQHRLLMLSRGYNVEMERSSADVVVQHVGLGTEQIQMYIDLRLPPHEAIDMRGWVKRNPSLSEIMSVPVNLNILCYLWRDQKDKVVAAIRGGSLPSLYGMVTRYVWDRYVQERPKANLSRDDRDRLFDTLGLRHIHAQDGGFLLLEWVDGASLYHFPHLTFQEYFAGNWLASRILSGDEDENEKAKIFFDQNKYAPWYGRTYSFMAGEIAKRHGFPGVSEAIALVNEGSRDIVGFQHLLLQLRILNEWIALTDQRTVDKYLDEINKRFAIFDSMDEWFTKGIATVELDVHRHMPTFENWMADSLEVLRKSLEVLRKYSKILPILVSSLLELHALASIKGPRYISQLEEIKEQNCEGGRQCGYFVLSCDWALSELREGEQTQPQAMFPIEDTMRNIATSDKRKPQFVQQRSDIEVKLRQAKKGNEGSTRSLQETYSLEDFLEYCWGTGNQHVVACILREYLHETALVIAGNFKTENDMVKIFYHGSQDPLPKIWNQPKDFAEHLVASIHQEMQQYRCLGMIKWGSACRWQAGGTN